jgi:hypothetical protein
MKPTSGSAAAAQQRRCSSTKSTRGMPYPNTQHAYLSRLPVAPCGTSSSATEAAQAGEKQHKHARARYPYARALLPPQCNPKSKGGVAVSENVKEIPKPALNIVQWHCHGWCLLLLLEAVARRPRGGWCASQCHTTIARQSKTPSFTSVASSRARSSSNWPSRYRAHIPRRYSRSA